MNRRSFITTSTTLAFASLLEAVDKTKLHIATNTYPWGTFAKREGKTLLLHTDELLSAIAATGITGYEPNMTKAEDFDGLAARLQAHGLEMRSIYVNSTLHDAERASGSIAEVLGIARRAAEMGVKIIVTNPSPIRWGGPEDKTDAQIMAQATALNTLGAELRRLGITLAYHNHDAELRQGGREFHHMLTATNPDDVKLCLDAHWIFRGSGESQVAVFDALEHYGSRIVELHLRQSVGGKWSEVFTAAGDLDYTRLKVWLDAKGIKPHLSLEQAVEKGSPRTLDVSAAHRASLRNVQALFSV
jgi:inosose dehydratase